MNGQNRLQKSTVDDNSQTMMDPECNQLGGVGLAPLFNLLARAASR